MTKTELAKKYNVSENSITSNFTRVQQSILKKYGVHINKTGRGDKTDYYEEITDYSDKARALTIYESTEHNLIPIRAASGLLDIHFLIFVGIISSPMRVFRGSYIDLLQYLEIEVSDINIERAKQVLRWLTENDYIMYTEDKTDHRYFMASILRETETQMSLEIDTILYFKSLVANTRKQWIPLMKIYLALHILNQPCTIKELSDTTNLSEYKVRDSLNILESQNIIARSKVYHQNQTTQHYYCLGTNIDINAFGVQPSAFLSRFN